MDDRLLSGEFFMSGDIACAEGALSAGCRFFAGYPITPATEIAERMSYRMPQVGGTYIQMEDEIASMNGVLGASWGGLRAMTATSGPGFSLMMENLGLGIMTETPCVLVNVQRGGPSTGLPTLVGQGDMMQARWGSHGVYEIIALSPSSPQEFFDLTIRAFNLAEKYRTPVLVMADEVVGHMTERVVIPPPEEIPYFPRRKPKSPPGDHLPFPSHDELVPPMANAGDGYHIHVTGLTHDERGYPATDEVTQERLVRRLVEKIRRSEEEIITVEEQGLEGAEVVVCSYGISARVSMEAVELARREGTAVGMMKLLTVWPFPEERLREVGERVRAFVVPEINNGQIALEVKRAVCGRAEVIPVTHLGGGLHKPEDIVQAIREGAG